MKWLSMAEVAKAMEVDHSTAWRRLTKFQRLHPDREILRGYNEQGKRTGKLLVCSLAMLEVMHADREDKLEVLGNDVDAIDGRVGSLETFMEVIKIRIRKLEKAEKTHQNTRAKLELLERLIALDCISLQKSPPLRGPRKG